MVVINQLSYSLRGTLTVQGNDPAMAAYFAQVQMQPTVQPGMTNQGHSMTDQGSHGISTTREPPEVTRRRRRRRRSSTRRSSTRRSTGSARLVEELGVACLKTYNLYHAENMFMFHKYLDCRFHFVIPCAWWVKRNNGYSPDAQHGT